MYLKFDWNPIIDNLIPVQLPKYEEISNKRRFVRNVVMDWLNERFFPDKRQLTLFEKCICLFDKSCLHDISVDYYNKIYSQEKHWIEYVHAILEDIRLNYSEPELEEKLKGNNIKSLDFVERLIRISGFIQRIRLDFTINKDINDVNEYIKKEMEDLGMFYGLPYTSETDNIMTQVRYTGENVNDDALKKMIIGILESREIPSEYENPLMFDRCYEEEEDGTIFGIKIEPNFERHGLPRQQRRIQQEKGS